MHVTSPTAVRRLMTQHAGRLRDLRPAVSRRPLADGAARTPSGGRGSSRSSSRGPAWRVPAAHPGDGERLLEATRQQGLEGVVAKRLDSPLRARPAYRGVAEDQEHAPPGDGDRRLAPGRGPQDRPDRGAARWASTRTASSAMRVGSAPGSPRRRSMTSASASRRSAATRARSTRGVGGAARARRCSSSLAWSPRSSSASGPPSG